MIATLPKRLPPADDYGNYYLGSGIEGKPRLPAIFKGGCETKNVEGKLILVRQHGDLGERWFICLPDRVEFYYNDIRYFPTPQEALAYMREMVVVTS